MDVRSNKKQTPICNEYGYADVLDEIVSIRGEYVECEYNQDYARVEHN